MAPPDQINDALPNYQTIIEHALEGVWLLRPDGTTFYVNQCMAKMLGHDPAELFDRSPLDFVADADKAAAIGALSTQPGNKFTPPKRMKLRHRDGRLLRAMVSVGPLLLEGGIAAGTVVLAIDVSDRAETERRFQLIADATNDLVWEYDIKSGKVWRNKQVGPLFGYTEEEAEGIADWWISHIHPDDRAENDRSLREAFESDTDRWKAHYRFLRKNGTIAHVEDRGFILRDEAGRPLRMIGGTTDISDRKLSEDANQVLSHRIQTIIETLNDGFVILDTEFRFTFLNRHAEILTGRSRWDLLGKNHWDEFPETRGTILQQEYERALRDGVSVEFKSFNEVLRKWFEIRAYPSMDGLTIYFRDFTEQKKAEERLALSRRRFEVAAQCASDLIYDYEIATGHVDWFGKTDELLGYPPGGFQRTIEAWEEVVLLEDRARAIEELKRHLESPETYPFAVEYRVRTLDGRVLHWFDRGQGLRDEFGTVARMIGAVTDITEQRVATAALEISNRDLEQMVAERTQELRELMENLQRSNAELAAEIIERKKIEFDLATAKELAEAAREEADRANHAKSDFLSRMSHELRTPLNAILGFAQVLELEDLDDSQYESVKHILNGGKHLLGLINEVLDIARIEAGGMVVSLESIQVRDLLRQSIELLSPAIEEHHLQVEWGGSAEEICALADHNRLRQVFINVLSNAIKYNRPGGTIRLEVSSGESILIRISDTGRGIEAENLDRVFVPFDRLGAERTGIEGTGLGLALCKRFIQVMKGNISVESEVGKGTSINIELRPSNDFPGTESDPFLFRAATETRLPVFPRRVLIIEDNVLNMNLFRKVFALSPDVTLILGNSGNEGLRLAARQLPDMIVLDLDLPDMAGCDVLRLIRETPETRPVPVLVVTADASPSQEEACNALGVQGFLTKPINVIEFLQVIDRIMTDSGG